MSLTDEGQSGGTVSVEVEDDLFLKFPLLCNDMVFTTVSFCLL